MSVLDAGCGTGSITAGMARRVGATGRVKGIDRDAALIAIARRDHREQANLSFDPCDISEANFESEFDVVSAARTLQWIGDPPAALANMVKAAKPGGLIAVLDYDHTTSLWIPAPPRSFQSFYHAFLDWRSANGWDNRIAVHLRDLFESAGLENVEVLDSDEVYSDAGSEIWLKVIESLGPALRQGGFNFDPAVEVEYSRWLAEGFEGQVLSMKTAFGTKPKPLAPRYR